MFFQPYVRKVRQLLGGPGGALVSERDEQLAQQLVGTWKTDSITLAATRPLSARQQGKFSASQDAIARTNERLRTEHWAFRLTLRADYTYAYEMRDPSRAFHFEVGQWQVRGGELHGTVAPELAVTMQAQSAVKGQVMTINSTELVVRFVLWTRQSGLEEVIRSQRVSPPGSTI